MEFDEYGLPIEEEANTERDAKEVAAELVSLLAEETDDPLDFSEKYNTELEPYEKPGFEGWIKQLSARDGRDASEDLYDYDLPGMYKDLGGALPEPGYEPDTYKKPNHPTFSNESKYNETDGYKGGVWENGMFVVGETNMHSPDELQGYFYEKHKDDDDQKAVLYDQRVNSKDTAMMKHVIDRDAEFGGKLMSDAEVIEQAEREGKKGWRDVWKDLTDMKGGDNVFVHSALQVASRWIAGIASKALVGKAATAGAGVGTAAVPVPGVGTATGLVIGGVIGIIGSMLANKGAEWISSKDDVDVRSLLVKLEADEYADPNERERDERIVSDWSNEKRVFDARGESFIGQVTGVWMGSLPYIAQFASATKATQRIAGGIAGRGRVATGVRSALNELAETGALKPNQDAARGIISRATRLMEKGQYSSLDAAIISQHKVWMERAGAAFIARKQAASWGIAGIATATGAPGILKELENQSADKMELDDKGNITFKDPTLGETSRAFAMSYVDSLMERLGGPLAKKVFLTKPVRKAFGKVLSSIPEGSRAASAKAMINHAWNSDAGKVLTGRTKIMKSFYAKAGVNNSLEEFTEEYMGMSINALLNFDKDQRGDMSYSRNILDKVLFPVSHPVETAAMITAFSITPAAAGVFSAARGDLNKEAFQDTSKLLSRIRRFSMNNEIVTKEQFNDMMDKLVNSDPVVRAMKLRNASKSGASKFTKIVDFAQDIMLSNKDMLLTDLGLTKRGFAQMIDAHEAKILKDGKLKGEAAEALAVELALSTYLIGHVVNEKGNTEVNKKNNIEKLIEVLRSDGILGNSGDFFHVETDPKTGRQIVRPVIEVTEAGWQNLSTELRKFVGEMNNVIYVDKPGSEAKARRNSQSIPAEMIESVKTAKSEKELALAKEKVIEFLGQKGMTREFRKIKTDKGQRGSLPPTQAGETENAEQLDSLADAVIETVLKNPDQKIVLTDPSISEAVLTKTEQKKLAKERGREVELGRRSLVTAWNDNKGTIFITPAMAGEKGKDSAARILEEERLEVSIRAGREGSPMLNDAEKSVLRSAAQDLTNLSKTLDKNNEGEVRFKKFLMQKTGEISRGIRNNPKMAFEQYIELVQLVKGRHNENLSENEQAIVGALSADTIKALNETAVDAFDQKSGLDLDWKLKAKRTEARYREQKRAERKARVDKKHQREMARDEIKNMTGAKAVKKFLRTKGSAQEERQEAIRVIRERLDRKLYSTEDSAVLAGMVLEELENARGSQKKSARKTKAAIESVEKSFPEISYHAKAIQPGKSKSVIQNTTNNDRAAHRKESENTDTNSAETEEMNWDQDLADELESFSFGVALLEQTGSSEASFRMTMMAMAEGFLQRATESAEAWTEWRQAEGGTTVEQILREAANARDITFAEAFRFNRFRESLHLFPAMTIDEWGNIRQTNRVELVIEMNRHMESIFNDPLRVASVVNAYYSAVESDSLTSDEMFRFLSLAFNVPSEILREASAGLIKDDKGPTVLRSLFKSSKKGDLFYEITKLKAEKGISGDFYKEAGQLISKTLGTVDAKKEGKKILGGFVSVLMDHPYGQIASYRPGYSNVAGKRVTSLLGDSHMATVLESLKTKYWGSAEPKMGFAIMLDGKRNKGRNSNVEASELYGEELEKITFNIAKKSLLESDGESFLMHLGRFGEKGTHMFIRVPVGSIDSVKAKAKDMSKLLSSEATSKKAREMFVDPVAYYRKNSKNITDKDGDRREIINFLYATFGIETIMALHGNVNAYATKDSVIENIFNVVKRASQIMTPGIAIKKPFSLIYVNDKDSKMAESIPGFSNEAFDGMSVLVPRLEGEPEGVGMPEMIADYLGDELMRGSASADTFKGHISVSDSEKGRSLTKVNWSNLKMLASTNVPEWQKVLDYVQAWNTSKAVLDGKKKRIDAIALNSGAKLRAEAPETVISTGNEANTVTMAEGSLVRSQWLNHVAEINHEGVLAKQRAAHMASGIMKRGLKALGIRNQVAMRRAENRADIQERLKDEHLVTTDSPQFIIDALSNGESLNDPRYSEFVFDKSLGVVRDITQMESARVATQKIGEGSLGLPGYKAVETVIDEEAEMLGLDEFAKQELRDRINPNGYTRLPRMLANIKGARLSVKREFESREAAVEFMERNPNEFDDMLIPDEDGRPQAGQYMLWEIEVVKEGDGRVWYKIPGEPVEETRVPSDNYTSHMFARLDDWATQDKEYREQNISITPDGIRRAKGEDFDGDKGFILMFYRGRKNIESREIFDMDGEFFQMIRDAKGRVRWHIENDEGEAEVLRDKEKIDRLNDAYPDQTYTYSVFDDAGGKKESDRSIMNRALNLEMLDWIEHDSFSLYNIENDIPIDLFDKIVDQHKSGSELDFHLNSPSGIANHAMVNHGSSKAIGAAAVYNSMYSTLSSFNEDMVLRDLLIGPTAKDKAIDNAAKTDISYEGLEIPSRLSFANYGSAKRMIGILLNIIIDDPKNPRTYFLNINNNTVGPAIWLMMNNIKTNDLNEHADIKKSKAYEEAFKVMEFIAGPVMQAYNNYFKKTRYGRLMRTFLEEEIPKINESLPANEKLTEQQIKDGVEFGHTLHTISEKLFNVTTVLDAAYTKPFGIKEYRNKVNAFNSIQDGFNGLMSSSDSMRMFGSESPNAAIQLAHLNYKMSKEMFARTPQAQLTTTDEIKSEGTFVALGRLIAASAYVGHAATKQDLFDAHSDARQELKDNQDNLFVEKVALEERKTPKITQEAVSYGGFKFHKKYNKDAGRVVWLRYEKKKSKNKKASFDTIIVNDQYLTEKLDEMITPEPRIRTLKIDRQANVRYSEEELELIRDAFSKLSPAVQRAFVLNNLVENGNDSYISGGYAEFLPREISKQINDKVSIAIAGIDREQDLAEDMTPVLKAYDERVNFNDRVNPTVKQAERIDESEIEEGVAIEAPTISEVETEKAKTPEVAPNARLEGETDEAYKARMDALVQKAMANLSKSSNNSREVGPALVSLPQVSASKSTYSGLRYNIDFNLKRKSDDMHIAARFHRTGEKAGTMSINPKAVADTFNAKAWTEPKVEGVNALPADSFPTLASWLNFLMEHEYQHGLNVRRDGETVADYENRINQAALDALSGSQTDTKSVELGAEDFKNWKVYREGSFQYEDKSPIEIARENGVLYRGLNAATIDQALRRNADGSLTLLPQSNMGGKTFGVSTTPYRHVAWDYATRDYASGTSRHVADSGLVLTINTKIENQANYEDAEKLYEYSLENDSDDFWNKYVTSADESSYEEARAEADAENIGRDLEDWYEEHSPELYALDRIKSEAALNLKDILDRPDAEVQAAEEINFRKAVTIPAGQWSIDNVSAESAEPGNTYNARTVKAVYTNWAFSASGSQETVQGKMAIKAINEEWADAFQRISESDNPIYALAELMSKRAVSEGLVSRYADYFDVSIEDLKMLADRFTQRRAEQKRKLDLDQQAEKIAANKAAAEYQAKVRDWAMESDVVHMKEIPEAMSRVLKKIKALEADETNSEIHYETIINKISRLSPDHGAQVIGFNHIIENDTERKLKALGIKKSIRALRFNEKVSLSRKEAEELLALDTYELVESAKKIIPGFESMPGNLQALAVVHQDQIKSAFSKATMMAMSDNAYLKAAQNHLRELVEAKSNELLASNPLYDFLNDLIKTGAYLETQAVLADGRGPNMFDRSGRRGADAAFEYISDRNLSEKFAKEGFSNNEAAQLANMLASHPVFQVYAIEKLSNTIKDNEPLLGQARRAIRMSNEAPRKHDMQRGTTDGEAGTSDSSYNSRAIVAAEQSVAGLAGRGEVELHRRMKQMGRTGRSFKVRARILTSRILSNTGTETFIDEAGKKHRATAESKTRGAKYRQALSVLAELPAYKWGKAYVYKALEDGSSVPGEINTIEVRILFKYMNWLRETYGARIAQKAERQERGQLMLKQFAEEVEKDYRGANRQHLYQLTKFIFGSDTVTADLHNGNVSAVMKAYSKFLNEHAPEKAIDIVKDYEIWRTKEMPHLPAWDGENTLKEYRKLFRDQFDFVNELAKTFGDEWISEWKATGYIPHYWGESRPWEESFDSVRKEIAHAEKRRKYKTWQEGIDNGKAPQTLDIAELYELYTNDLLTLVNHRTTISMMALTPDYDGLPMILLDDVKESGIITDNVARRLADGVIAAYQHIDPSKRFSGLTATQTGFERLAAIRGQINMKDLGYEQIENNFKSAANVWVKAGQPHSIAKHIFYADKEIKNRYARWVFDAILAFNHLSKSIAIAASFFHPFALVESFVAADGLTGKENKGNLLLHPVKTAHLLKAQYRKMLLDPEYGSQWIDAGLMADGGHAPNFLRPYTEVNSKIVSVANGLLGSKNPFAKSLGAPMLAIGRLKGGADWLLWEAMLPSMKLYTAESLFSQYKASGLDGGQVQGTDFEIREKISAYVNDAFGGQEWQQYTWANPFARKILHSLWFAPDWTLSALNISGLTHYGPLKNMLRPPTSDLHAKERMQTYWPAFAAIVLTIIPNLLQAGIYLAAQAAGGGDDDDEMFSFNNEIGHRMSVDITPIIRALGMELGKTGQRRAYMRWGKQAYEVFEGWLGDPVSTIIGKSSPAVKVALEQGLGIVKPGWQTPWADKSFFGSLIAVDGEVWDGRIANMVQKFIPMSIRPILDEHFKPGTGKPAAFIAPVRLGMSSYAAQKEIASVMRAYAEGGLAAKMKGLPNYERDLDNLVEDILDAAEKNGWNRRKVMSQGLSSARTYYYNGFFEALNKGNKRLMERNAEELVRVETKYSSLKASVTRRLETKEEKLRGENRRNLGEAWREGMRRAADQSGR